MLQLFVPFHWLELIIYSLGGKSVFKIIKLKSVVDKSAHLPYATDVFIITLSPS